MSSTNDTKVKALDICIAQPDELADVGNLMAEVYSQLDGFPSKAEQPQYYEQFTKLAALTESEHIQVIVAKTEVDGIIGGLIFYTDVKHYGAGGSATTSIPNAAAIRLLAVSASARGNGVGRMLTEHCIALARTAACSTLILHTTRFMPTAWSLYEKMGFARYTEIDFKQKDLDVYGFQLAL